MPDWTNPQSLNRYSYCLNNPLKYVDPSGYAYADNGILSPGEMLQLYAEIIYYDNQGGESEGGYYPEDWDCEDAVKYLGIDSDWGDVLSQVEWGDRFLLFIDDPNDAVTTIGIIFGEGGDLKFDFDTYEGISLLGLMYTSTAARDARGYSASLFFGCRYNLNDNDDWYDPIVESLTVLPKLGVGEPIVYGAYRHPEAALGSLMVVGGGICLFGTIGTILEAYRFFGSNGALVAGSAQWSLINQEVSVIRYGLGMIWEDYSEK